MRLVRWHPISSDVVLNQQSKAHGVSKVIGKLGLKPENVLTFGDGLNDIELFDIILVLAVAKETPGSIKAKTDYVTKEFRRRWHFPMP